MAMDEAPTSAYAQAARALGTPRSIEHRVFARITGKLRRASEKPVDFPALAEALHENLALWSAISADVADSRNSLPANLRAQLLYLGEFTRVQTRALLRGEGAATALIDINTAVMRGLRGSTAS